MTLTLDMIRAAKRAPKAVADRAPRVAAFIKSKLNPDGGFAGRAADSDLYYTVFGLESLIALNADFPRESVAKYLRTFRSGQALDLVHLASLIRCWSSLSPPELRSMRSQLVTHLQTFSSEDGGFNISPDSANGTVYACFLALAAYQDLQIAIPDPGAVIASIESLKTPKASYSNDRNIPAGAVPATAAALVTLHYLDAPIDNSSADWLLSCHSDDGGFTVVPYVPIPDLLSTATALHALATIGVNLTHIKPRCIDFLNTIWNPAGAFCASRLDKHLDCEYTYYGLLALGHLTD